MSQRFFRCSLALPLLTLLALAVLAGCGSTSGAPGDANLPTNTASATVLATNTPESSENQVDVSDFQFSLHTDRQGRDDSNLKGSRRSHGNE